MKKILLFLFVSIAIHAQKIKETIVSEKLNEDRQITISLPKSYEASKNKKYPILIVLDGNYLLDSFISNLTYGAMWDEYPEAIIVGIDQSKDREDDCRFDPQSGLPEKKGVAFFEFIGGEVLPFIEKKYRTVPFRIIAGHDLTAAYLNFFLYKEASIFDAYIAISPDLMPLMESLIPEKLANIKQDIFYFQSYTNEDFTEKKETIQTLDQGLKTIKNDKLHSKTDAFQGVSHFNVVLPSISSALNHIFAKYKPINLLEYSEKIVVLPNGYTTYLEEKYAFIEKTLQLNIPIRITDFKAIEAAILKNNVLDELEPLAVLANTHYPKTMLGDYYMALLYELRGDTKRAGKKYQQASQMEEIGNLTKKMMYDKMDDMKTQMPPK